MFGRFWDFLSARLAFLGGPGLPIMRILLDVPMLKGTGRILFAQVVNRVSNLTFSIKKIL